MAYSEPEVSIQTFANCLSRVFSRLVFMVLAPGFRNEVRQFVARSLRLTHGFMRAKIVQIAYKSDSKTTRGHNVKIQTLLGVSRKRVAIS